jgi:calcineurin-like phosphoesterase family protein
MIWLWSDLHFFHKNILEYSNRPFSSVEEMEDELVKRHNALVSTHDKVIYVGDVFFCDQMEASRILKRLNGYKILVLGNHDLKANAMYKIGFDFVVQSMQIRVGKNRKKGGEVLYEVKISGLDNSTHGVDEIFYKNQTYDQYFEFFLHE